MAQYDFISILFLFRFIAHVQDLQRDNFLVETMNRRGVIRIYTSLIGLNVSRLLGEKGKNIFCWFLNIIILDEPRDVPFANQHWQGYHI